MQKQEWVCKLCCHVHTMNLLACMKCNAHQNYARDVANEAAINTVQRMMLNTEMSDAASSVPTTTPAQLLANSMTCSKPMAQP